MILGRFLAGIILISLGIGIGLLIPKFDFQDKSKVIIKPIKLKPLEKYTIENLAKTDIRPGELKIEKTILEDKLFTSFLFFFKFNPDPKSSEIKKTSGLINLPNKEGQYPIILMLRGFVDQKLYKTGMGTKRAGEYFAKNGFITLAPDFLGYADSDPEAANIFESRFQTYTTVLSLLKSLSAVEQWNNEIVFIWGHSNGGQIALTILEITQANYPTTLWAPVSKPFPYSILYYTDESEDKGRLIRSELAKFEEDYDSDLYSISQYYDRIKAPIQLHQGTSDGAVPKSWSDKLSKTLLDLNLNLDYFVYPNTDHNLNSSWNKVVERDLLFFQNHLK